MQTRYKEQIFYDEGSKMLDCIQKHGKCLIPGNIHSGAGQSSAQPHLVEDVCAYCRRDPCKSLPTKTIPSSSMLEIISYESMYIMNFYMKTHLCSSD